MPDISGQTIKGYEIHTMIGGGGFGDVYQAFQSTVAREVAIKVIHPNIANEPDFVHRFEIEAQLVARLEHPHIVPLYDYWREPNNAYLVMRLMRGGNLKEAIKREGAYDLEATAQLLDQICAALDRAHRQGIIHRDLKPANILLDEDKNAYLGDFGIAKDLDQNTENLTEPNALVGSLDYLAPEQARFEPVTPRTDIYSLGVVLFEMLAGEHPFPNLTPVERLFKHLNEPLPDLPADNKRDLEGINELIQKATAKNPAHRFGDALEIAQAFREVTNIGRTQWEENIVSQFTWREQEILQLLVEGKSNSEIAQELVIAVSTVRWYLKQIYKKLGVRSRVQAVVRARELNLIVSESADEIREGWTSKLYPEPANPYKGLSAFQAADAHDFYGRETLTKKLLSKLNQDGSAGRFQAIIGPSGSGKSSLVKAGLIPAIWRGELPGSEHWFMVDMLPGTHPLDELEVALTRLASDHSTILAEHLQRDERGLLRVANLILPDDKSELVIFIDQFEEIFTLVEDESRRTFFLDLIDTAVTDPRSRVRIIITLRADFYDRPLHYPGFAELVQTHTETILPLTAEELERAIVRPAEQVGVTFEEGLVTTIVGEVHYQSGALPLLQYALTELFEQRDGRLLTHEAYQAIGGTIGALAGRADDIFQNFKPETAEIARQMFLRLVTLGEGVEDTRRRVARHELLAITDAPDQMDEIIDIYAEYRLLSLDHDPASREPTVELAHEAILREWDRLRDWLNDSRADIRLQRQLDRAAAEWQAAAQDTSFLLRGARLEQFEGWSRSTELALTPEEAAYLQVSLADRDRRLAEESARQAREVALEQRSRNFLRALVGVFAVAAVIAISLSIFAFDQQGIAQSESQSRATQQAIAEEQADIADANAEDALAEAEARATQQAIAEEQRMAAENEADARATQQAIAESERVRAEDAEFDALRQASIGLGSQAELQAIGPRPERAVLLALEALENYPYTWQAEHALAQAVLSNRLVRDLNHGAYVNYFNLSPDGTQYVTAGDDDYARLWDVATGEEMLAVFQPGAVQGAYWSPAGDQILTSSINGDARIWDAETGAEQLVLSGYGGWYADWSPDGEQILTTHSFEENTAVIWDAVTGERLQTLEGHTNVVNSGRYFSDGTRIVTGSWDGTAKVWDAETGEELFTLSGHEGGMSDVKISPDGKYIATAGNDTTARIWDPVTGEELQTLAGLTGFVILFWSGDGKQLLTVEPHGLAKVWDVETGKQLQSFTGDGQIWYAAWSPDDKWVALVGEGGRLFVWDVATGLQVFTIRAHTSLIAHVVWTPDGQQIMTSGSEGHAKVWRVADNTLLSVGCFPDCPGSPVGGWSMDPAWSHTGDRITRGYVDGTIAIFDVASGSELLRMQQEDSDHFFGGAVSYLMWSPDDEKLLTTSVDSTAYIWDTSTGELIQRLCCHQWDVYMGAWSPDGSRILTVGYFESAKVWDSNTGQELLTFDGHTTFYGAWSPDGSRIVTTDDTPDTGGALVWDAATGEVLLRLYPEGFGYGVRTVDWSPDGSRIATFSDDGFGAVWDADSGEKLLTFSGHTAEVWSIHWSPDGSRLLTGSNDGTARVWNAATGEEVYFYELNQILNPAWSPDGQAIAISDFAGDLKIFPAWKSLDELIEDARECCVFRQLTPEERGQFGLPPVEPADGIN